VAKTYPAIGPFAPGDILTAATMTNIDTNLENQRVPPMVKCLRSTSDQTGIATGSATNLQWNAEAFDTDTMHDNVTNNDRITFGTAGAYVVTGSARITFGGTLSLAQASIRQTTSGVTTVRVGFYQPQAQSTVVIISMQAVVSAAVNDYVTFTIEALTGATGTISHTAVDQAYFSALWVGQTA